MTIRTRTRRPAAARSARRLGAAGGALLLAVGLAGCGGGYPADIDGTLERVRGHELVVGVAEDLPHLEVADDGGISGEEAEILAGYAEHLGAELVVTQGSETDIVAMLDRGEIDIAAGGFPDDTAWSSDAAVTRPYGKGVDGEGKEEKLVFLLKLGENAFLGDFERYLRDAGHEA